jgi:uncharacterized protein YdaL
MSFKYNHFFKLCLLFTIISFNHFTLNNNLSAGQMVSLEPVHNRVNAVRFDPSYYYNSAYSIDELSERLVDTWKNFDVNTVFFKVYDPIYGAKYRTKYEYNIETDYGKMDLLKRILREAQKADIRILAWIPAFQHKQVWEQNPEWRTKLPGGEDYTPTDNSYFLCPAHPEVRTWWLGFIDDIVRHYDGLSGIDIAEPIITWNGSECYCDYCSENLHNRGLSSASGMLETLGASVDLVHKYQKICSVTSVVSVHPDGSVYSGEEQIQRSGFDLEGLLSSAVPPDWINLELMWQQWAAQSGNRDVFNAAWTGRAAKAIIEQVNQRSRLIGHVEFTSFGEDSVSNEDLLEAVVVAKEAGIQNIDIYDTHLMDQNQSWGAVKEAFQYIKTKNVLVCHDSLGTNDARQVASLLSHFKTEIRLLQFGNSNAGVPENFDLFDVIFYVGVDPAYMLPDQFLRGISQFEGELVWIHMGIEQLVQSDNSKKWGFTHDALLEDPDFDHVIYKGKSLPKLDPAFNRVSIKDETICSELAVITNGEENIPYVIKSDNLWYVVDLPTAFVTEGGRHAVFSDLLHDMLDEDHMNMKTALVRIEDVHPLNDPDALKKIADYLESENVPFSVAVVPFYLDPESNVAVGLSDRPELVQALKYMIRSGGTIVMHGTTHQYRGETTSDYEFWDTISNSPLFSDSKEYIYQKILTGLNEFRKNEIYPLIWETPHYGASQLDYSVINQFFSTSYERRQTVDAHGSDQLLPYLIYNHTAGGKIIPENHGYIPLDAPDAEPILQAAERYLVIRDGVASFFFHPFVDHSVLKDLIQGFKEEGYSFVSPRLTQCSVVTGDMFVLTGEGEVSLNLENKFLREFYIDDKGRIRDDRISKEKITGKVEKHIKTPSEWIFVAEGIEKEKSNYFARTLNSIVASVSNLPHIFSNDSKLLDDEISRPARVVVLIDEAATGEKDISQKNFSEALSTVGIDAREIAVKDFFSVPSGINLIIVPHAAAVAMNEQQNLFLLRSLQNGLNLIFEKKSRVSEGAGIIPGSDTFEIHQVVDEYYPQVDIQWYGTERVETFDTNIDYVTYYSEKISAEPVVIGGEYGDGKYLYMASYFDPHTNGGYGRYPYFIDLLKRQFDLVPSVRRSRVEIYFEPGDREESSIEDLVKVWRKEGVNRIYVSAWHFYAEYVYDYERLIRLAHQNAMYVYATFRLPYVTDLFWENNPQWRELTASGDDAEVQWRKLMALNIPDCRDAVFTHIKNVLTEYDWDGVNIADLHYEAPGGYEDPDHFTPMNADIRRTFRSAYGFDPIALFNSKSQYFWRRNYDARRMFDQFREAQIVSYHRDIFDFLRQFNHESGRDLKIMVTVLDDTFNLSAARNKGVNTPRIADIAREFSVELHVKRTTSSSLETQIASSGGSNIDYAVLNLTIDRRDLSRDRKAPTVQSSGTELYITVEKSPRAIINSEASIYDIDFPMISYTLAHNATEEIEDHSWSIATPHTVQFAINVREHQDVMVDNRIWPAYYRGNIIIPAGEHRIEPISKLQGIIKRFKSKSRLINMSGELIAASAISRGLWVEYSSAERNYVILTHAPREIFLDGKPLDPPYEKVENGTHLIELPKGEHVATIYTQSAGMLLLSYVSIAISSLIIFIGFIAGGMLSLIYVKNRIRSKH